MRIASPPVVHPCFYGIDTPNHSELLNNRLSVEEAREYLGADTLAYVSLAALQASVGAVNDYCLACFNGEYFHDSCRCKSC